MAEATEPAEAAGQEKDENSATKVEPGPQPSAPPLTIQKKPEPKFSLSRETPRLQHQRKPATKPPVRERSMVKDDGSIKPGTAEISFSPTTEQGQLALREQTSLQREHSKLKYPHQVMKMSTVSMSARPRPIDQDLFQKRANYVEPKNTHKVVTWEEATNSRPPLRIDLDGPGPCSYSPQNKPLYETNAPQWSFGKKTFVEKRGGSRTSWEKTWFQNSHLWHQKADFHSERVWPSPPAYNQPSSLGPRQATNTGFPAFSVGVRRAFTINKKGSGDEPSPNEYNSSRADVVLLRKAPSFSHGHRRGGTVLWSSSEGYSNPGPGAYEPGLSYTHQHKPAFTIRGIRRGKVHELGPFATL